MADPQTVEFAAYGSKLSQAAVASRKQLPGDLQLVLFDVLDELCGDPNKYPRRCRPISRDGRVRVYMHPDPPLEITYEVDPEAREIYFMHFAATSVNVRKKVFISYSHQDMDWLEQLKKWLKPLEQSGLLEFWDDSKIEAGEDWRQAIKDAMASARLAVLLVSQNFLASDFIPSAELTPILEQAESDGVAVLWIALSESTYEGSPIERFQAVNDPKMPLDTLEPKDLNKQFKEIYLKLKEKAHG
jgi:TIR domain